MTRPERTIVRWGILGLGRAAHDFAKAFTHVPNGELVAVASRSPEKANAFADQYAVPLRFGSYDRFAADAEIDIVYVATPNTVHHEHALLCIASGKAVLCEKPFMVNAAQAQAIASAAGQKSLFLMEGMWTRFFPVMGRMRELIAQGAIGEPRLLQADSGFRARYIPDSRLFSPDLGGGGLLDVGVYPISLASMIFGVPSRQVGLAHIGANGLDEQAGMVIAYPGGGLAVLATAIRSNTSRVAVLHGTDGRITIPGSWWMPDKIILTGKTTEDVIEMPYEGNGLQFEIEEANACLSSGKIESAILPVAETITIMQTMDSFREQWAVKYPNE